MTSKRLRSGERGCRYIFPINLEIQHFVQILRWYIIKIVLVITPYKNNVSLITIITSIYGFKFWVSNLHIMLESEISVLQNCGYFPLVKFQVLTMYNDSCKFSKLNFLHLERDF